MQRAKLEQLETKRLGAVVLFASKFKAMLKVSCLGLTWLGWPRYEAQRCSFMLCQVGASYGK